ncbi:hypothetical protein JTE90_006887 [Oedothorax gibbosus]|uniref:Uncharacterized protein n=1 Tax=Oedothorax gibbosus TaxID=931172 RepID=A0AAV6VN94_9ARAC|nr:hypothetical protein JTE90_006887 [Oedothorax gibbosus]
MDETYYRELIELNEVIKGVQISERYLKRRSPKKTSPQTPAKSPDMTKFAEQSLVVFCCLTCFCLIAEAIDCRKFVFAPRCRGVSAKRSAKLNNEELRELGEMEESWGADWPARSSVSDDVIADSTTFDSRRKAILQKLLEKFNDYNLHDDEN